LTTEPPKTAAQLDDLHTGPEQAVLEQQQALGRAESRAQQNFLPGPEDDAKSLGAQSRHASRDPSRDNIGKRLHASKNSKQSQLQQRERELKNIAEDMSEEARKLAKKIPTEHFQQMCGDKDSTKKTPTSLRLSKQRFQQFLKGRFGIPFAEKIHNILDYTRAVDFASYQSQVEMIIKDRNFMLQLAFDVFDANDDRKISQLDLFKTFK
jgi:flagellar biosynthesis GTPase FlhF